MLSYVEDGRIMACLAQNPWRGTQLLELLASDCLLGQVLAKCNFINLSKTYELESSVRCKASWRGKSP